MAAAEGDEMARVAIAADKLEAVAAAVRGVAGVKSVRVWDKAAGRERLYIDLVSRNGGEGTRGATYVLDAAKNRTSLDEQLGWSGAKTRDWHAANGTLAAIREAVNSVVPEVDAA